MKRFVRSLALASAALFLFSGQALAAGTYGKIATITLPKASSSFDISEVDPATRTYYYGDRVNGVVAIDMDTNQIKAVITGFVGVRKATSVSGPDGVLLAKDRNELLVGDGDSTLKVVDLSKNAIVATISTGGTTRLDELAYDAKNQILAGTNPDEDVAFLNFISLKDRKVLGKITFPDATDGIEQPLFNTNDGMFYQNVPATKANPGGEIDVIDGQAMKIVRVIPLQGCGPKGLALGPNNHLMVGCGPSGTKASGHVSSVIVDAASGQVLSTVTEVGGSDMVWYNPGDNRYYLAARDMTSDGTAAGKPAPVLGVIDAATNKWIANVPTGPGAHSVAVDPKTNHVFVPVNGVGVMVFGLVLPNTGDNTGLLMGLGSILLVAGAVLLFVRKRRGSLAA